MTSSSVKMTKYTDNCSKLTVNYDIIILLAIFMYQDILQDVQCIQAVEMSEGLFQFLGKKIQDGLGTHSMNHRIKQSLIK